MRQSYLKVMASIVPMGAVGASFLLGSTLPSIAAERPVSVDRPVSERLAAIREAVLVVTGPGEISKLDHHNLHLTWANRWNNWGRRWGWGPPRWNNWRNGWPNWNNFWRNW